jgi:hypothetical protein
MLNPKTAPIVVYSKNHSKNSPNGSLQCFQKNPEYKKQRRKYKLGVPVYLYVILFFDLVNARKSKIKLDIRFLLRDCKSNIKDQA